MNCQRPTGKGRSKRQNVQGAPSWYVDGTVAASYTGLSALKYSSLDLVLFLSFSNSRNTRGHEAPIFS
jgi:hypothetical protein